MVGGGNRRDEGSFTVTNTNVFAALDSLRKKKKSEKEKGTYKGGKGTSKALESKEVESKKQVYWAPAPLTSKSWADVDDEDDDDYYANTAPPQPIWGGSTKAKETRKPGPIEESESEDDELFDEGDDDAEEEHGHEPEVQEQPHPVLKKPTEASPAPKESERQLSKKERKKKELAELEAILADFGVNPKEKGGDEPSDANKDGGQPNGDVDRKDNNIHPVESKSAKKKKKKDKAAKETQDPNSSNAPNGQEDSVELADRDVSAVVDVKEKLKKMASAKKKKPSKEMDGASRAAALEAAARNAKLAASKKKEKSHYNQQPMR